MIDFIINLAKRQKGDTSDAAVRNRVGTLGGIFGIAANLLLCTIKITVGLLSHSISIIADGLNNLSDMGSSVITMIGFKMAGKPADSDHPYGHGRMEYMSAFIVSTLIMLVGVELLKESANGVISGSTMPQYTFWAIIVLAVSVIIKFLMYLFNMALGRKINSDALKATAKDSINDSISTTVILIAVVVSRFVNIGFNLDAVLGIGVAIFIIVSGFTSAKDTLDVILGGPPEPELIRQIRDNIMGFDMFLGIHDLIVHNYGPNRIFASVHVEVSEKVDIVVCHEKIDLCEKLVKENTGVELVIHMDPIETDNAEIKEVKTAIDNALKQINHNFSLHDFRMTPKSENRINLIFDVVVPSSIAVPLDTLKKEICSAAKAVDTRYECVITFDNDYTGK